MVKKFLLFSVLFKVPQLFAYHYGTAGCGVGALLFKDKPGPIQAVASILNSTFGQLFSITSESVGCTDKPSAITEIYLEKNHHGLLADIAGGNGETIEGLAMLFECDNHRLFALTLKNHLKEIYPHQDATPKDIENNIIKAIKTNPELRATCNIS